MLLAERQERILRLVKTNGFMSVLELCDQLGASSATIRRDINSLCDNGLLLKTHGGAMDAMRGAVMDLPVNLRRSMNTEEKIRIATELILRIKEGDSLFLDSGTTTFEIAKKLQAFSRLTVVTHDLTIALDVSRNSSNSVIVIGGGLKAETVTCSGIFTERMISEIHVNKAIIAVDAVSMDYGCMCFAVDEVAIKRLMMKNSMESILVCDHSKFQNMAFVDVCRIRDFNMIITGSELEEKLQREIVEVNPNLICV